ncbi:AraC family transcriptional regulator [Paenibacillus sp. HWE-109]|uniref:AraC family transcriptional regulator n=1 Tax=Paenibacillus sp. HWE-109 TaxID=1306526 RepID=UPI001EDD385F|nr:AraC family transcriptional regulator [Paenibacillus sp. HWE-109]UKS27054.1 AraC family transcriptional regulator [Paenibacillus sp. HWE-109]
MSESNRNLLENLLFSSLHIYHYQGQAGGILRKRTIHFYAVCVITGGKGVVSINDEVYAAEQGDYFVFLPGMIVEGNSHAVDPIQYAIGLFSCMQVSKHRKEWRIQQPQFERKGKIQVPPDDYDIKAAADQLMNANANKHTPNAIKRKYDLHHLLMLLMTCSGVRGDITEAAVGMAHALAYMNENFMKDTRIGELARIAGYSTNHFIRTFKDQMNMTPTEYVLKQRMAKAKQLLFSSEKMKEVAQQVGYKDEHYFSRVFKKAEGTAPTLYLKDQSRRIATLYYGIDDYLLTLGLKPVAALSYVERVSHTYPVDSLTAFNKDVVRLDSMKLNYNKLIQTKPDLILTSDRLEENEALKHIAPTAVLKHSNDSSTMLAYIAGILGREQQAAVWLDSYAERKQAIQKKIKEKWGKQTAYCIRVSPTFYRIYGIDNQIGSLLYEDAGLTLPSAISAQEWAIDIQLQDLNGYNADHIFLMTDPTEASRQRLHRLLESEEWRSLDAVRNHQVYDASDLRFKTLGPAGRMWALNDLADQLRI